MADMRDDELRDAFGALHRSVQRSAPVFEALASPAGLEAARRRYRTQRALLLGALVVIPSVVIARTGTTATFDFERFSSLTGLDPGAVTWNAPSDFLLSIPGSDLLQAVPSIAVPVPAVRDDSLRARGAKPSLRRSSDI